MDEVVKNLESQGKWFELYLEKPGTFSGKNWKKLENALKNPGKCEKSRGKSGKSQGICFPTPSRHPV